MLLLEWSSVFMVFLAGVRRIYETGSYFNAASQIYPVTLQGFSSIYKSDTCFTE